MMKRYLPAILALGVLAAPALAHGLLMSVSEDGGAVTGRVYYSDGRPGVGEFVELRDLGNPAGRARSGTTDPQGRFRFPAEPGRRYAVIAHGEEGHTTEMQLTLAEGERGRLVDAGLATAEDGGHSLPPAWMVIGGLLLLSALAAIWLRLGRRKGIVDTGTS